MKPPITAPAMPSRMVMIIPPGSLPGMTALAIRPAISPNIIHPRIASVARPPSRFLTDENSEMLNSGKTQMIGHTSSGAAVFIGGNVDNGMEITTPDEGLDGQYEILN